MTEIWKDIAGYEGLYQVSNMGRVKSLSSNMVMKPIEEKTGYMTISLYKNGVSKKYRLHRLVWEAFNGPIPEGMQCNHINERKDDNRLENLNLMTPKENNNWGTRITRVTAANINHPSKSKPILQFSLDMTFIREYKSTMDAERHTGIYHSNISKCCKGDYMKTTGGFIWKYKEEAV